MNKRTCIIIAGPTAVGKTSLALNLARYYNTSIISADSRQCFRELHIGVAKPTPAELAEIPHYFIDSHSVHETCNAAIFAQYATRSLQEIFQKNSVAVIVGGTGLYIRAFRDGLDEIPDVPAAIHEQVLAGHTSGGLAWLQDQLRALDPAYLSGGETANPQRLMRALEVRLATGLSIRQFQQGRRVRHDYSIVNIGLELPRPVLYERINSRVDQMVTAGLLEEVKSLYPFRHLNAMQTVGYRELIGFLEGRLGWAAALDLVRQNTRHYAKRQMTWFQRDSSMKWFSPLDFDQIIEHLAKLV
jgi:tRNA dimethylallyltransferase